MRLAVNLALSLGMLAVCMWLVWPNAHHQEELRAAFERIHFADFWPYLAGYLGLLALTHFCRAWRWNNLLAPIGVRLPPRRLLAISSVGFMAILALPARLGEFVRPALIRRKGEISASSALGTVAVERVVDGLLVSLFVFGAFFALREEPNATSWMMPTAYAALGIFTAAMLFLAFALRWPDRTIRLCVRMTGAHLFVPRLADVLEDKLRQLIRGFLVLKDRRNMMVFVAWSIIYWVANGTSVWLLARGFGLDLSPLGAFATMGLVAVGITLPNAPALAGQYQWFTQLGLTLYLGKEVGMGGEGLAFAIVLHGIQVVWYLGVGALALASPFVSFSEIWESRGDDEELRYDEEAQ